MEKSYLFGRLAGNGLAETDASGVTKREYLWLNDLPIAVVDNVNTASPTLYYVHTDHLGRPARMIAQSWAWVWDVVYMPFGAVSSIWDGTSKLDMRFPGQWFQMESGLAYNWHRHYDATLGRYVQPDPIGLKGGRSLYGYAGQNPLAYVDREGRSGVIGGAIEGAEIGGAIAGPAGAVGGVVLGGIGGYYAGDYLAGLIWRSDNGSKKCPDLPTDLTGKNPVKGSGKRINTDLPGGADDVFDKLSGGESTTEADGTRVAANGVRLRPGKDGQGPRIDIPANGSRPHETIHFP